MYLCKKKEIMCIGLQVNKELIGNLIVLIEKRCKPLYQTKLLKLLYLIDEESTIKTGTPVTWLTYKAWQFGPVAEDVYYSKNPGQNNFSKYVIFEHVRGNSYIVRPIIEFDDAEFSQTDLTIVNDVIDKYGRLSIKKLVSITHTTGSLWNKTIKHSGIRFSQNNKTSDANIDFGWLVENDGFKKTIFYATMENIELQAAL